MLIYSRLPIFFQNFFISTRSLIRKIIRDNEKSDKICSDIIKNEYSKETSAQYARSQLDSVLKNALEHTEYYGRTLIKTHNHITSSIDFYPYLTKDILRANSYKISSRKKPFFVISGSTSGTTGSPLTIPQSLDSVIREQAFVTRMLKWAGYKEGDKRAWIRGDLIVPINQKKPPYWRYSWFENMIMLSSFHMTTEALPLYIKAMVDYGVDIIQAYPSSIATLAKYLESKGEYYPGTIKSVITSSESISPEDRQVIEERFRCKVFDWYGQFERVAAIANCEHGRYHVLTDYSYVEFLDVGNGRHEIVGTTYNNLYYPLIRYKTGDHVILSKDKECPCGRVYPLVERIEGRVVDHVYAADGHKVYALDQCVKGVEGVLGSQYIQDNKGEITVRILPNSLFDKVQKDKLTANVKSRLGDEMIVNIAAVNKLERTKSGKVRQAICNIKGAL
ncbi:phenylacetate--CoA ligase family protein [Endozoicomonas ascidiicola]|uniref:phenylacetate--CoA ligase family protein n=1 Tax=Endozoicomonas ascidiicola TaxID=1698521 RepID=UPI00082C3ECF|nr:phenylacetate--CoA ligase family protein [Endozoicomonas ascidiicola]